jgi:hypothetical protein
MSYMGGHRTIPCRGSAARLEELLESIRMTFDSVSQDVELSKNQHNDYERRSSSLLCSLLICSGGSVQEVANIRGQIYDLEKTHSRIKQESVLMFEN